MKKKLIIVGALAVLGTLQLAFAWKSDNAETAKILENSSLEKQCQTAGKQEDKYLREHTCKLIKQLAKQSANDLMNQSSKLDTDNLDSTRENLAEVALNPSELKIIKTWSQKISNKKYWLAECKLKEKRILIYYQPGRRDLELVAVY